MKQEQSANQKLALSLFSVYLSIYLIYVLLNAFWPSVMEVQLLGINLAIWSGFLLIAGAFLLALIYGQLSKSTISSDHSK